MAIPWIKLHIQEWIQGTTRFQLSVIERAIWTDLLALAAYGRYYGIIASGKNPDGSLVGFPLSYLLSIIRVDEKTFDEALKKFQEQEKITYEVGSDNINKEKSYVIYITNWKKYQSESARVMQYYDKNKVTDKGGKKKKKKKDEVVKDVVEEQDDSDSPLINEVITYFNQQAGTQYKPSTKAIRRMINARIKEGATLDDFKKVIDKKAAQWKDDPKMFKYLRPITLFCAEKFEAYLNEPEPVKQESWRD